MSWQRIERDHPDVYQQYKDGKFPSARAAATAAGIPDQNTMVVLRRHWQRATQEQRETFLDEVIDDVLAGMEE